MFIIPCPDCKGIGLISFIYNQEEVDNDATVTPIYDFKLCNKCQGTAVIKVNEVENE